MAFNFSWDVFKWCVFLLSELCTSLIFREEVPGFIIISLACFLRLLIHWIHLYLFSDGQGGTSTWFDYMCFCLIVFIIFERLRIIKLFFSYFFFILEVLSSSPFKKIPPQDQNFWLLTSFNKYLSKHWKQNNTFMMYTSSIIH